MLTRRQFNTSLAAATLGSTLVTVHEVKGQDLPVIRLGNAAGIIDPQLAYQTMGQHPKLNYYKEEGVVLEIVNMSGSGQTLQTIAAGSVETSSTAPIAYLPTYAKDPTIDVFYVYCWLRTPHWGVGVKPDSPIKTLADLKGKNIGIRNQGDTGYIGARAMLKEIGLNPDADVDWTSVGEGGPAGSALYKGQIDAMAFWDGSFARMEIAGFPMRYLENTPGMKKLFGQAMCVRKSDFPKHKDIFTRFFRANARSTVFAYADTDLTIRMHWDIYPESKPKGLSDADALSQARRVINSRRDKWLAQPWQADKRFGAMSPEEWKAQVAFCGLSDKISDPSPCFTEEILDGVNNFDRDKILAQVKQLKAERG